MNNRKPYLQEQSANWWTENSFYKRYMLRELTSVFALVYALILLWGLYALSGGESSFISWLRIMASPGMVIVHVIGLISTLFHTVTWFELTPKIFYVYLNETKLADSKVAASQYGLFAIVTLIILALAVVWLNGG
ncbi:MAG: hypothetical protein U5L08_02235 [Xanthomonadales bacterium]|nr:hypothetical protein [Xanthomonadales bacterium]